MKNENEFPAENSMLDDLLMTDDHLDETSNMVISKEGTDESPDGFKPLNLNHLSASDWSVVVAYLMEQLQTNQITLKQTALENALTAPEGKMIVLACTIHPETADVRFTILMAPKSEFRS